ncbi:MAG: pitrilysin family protein [Bacteroidales bacterium]
MKSAIKYLTVIIISGMICSNVIGQTLNYEQYKLKNGLQVTLIDYGAVDATAINVYVNVGKKNETPGNQGISSFTAQALTLGNSKYTKIQIHDTLYPMGASISAGAGASYTRISATFLNKYLDKGMDVFAATIRQPTFPEAEVKQMISEFVQYNNPRKMDISELAQRFAYFFTFGISNPLGRNTYPAQVGKLTYKGLKEFYDFNYTPKNTRIVIAGKLDKEKIKKLIETYFGNWESVYGENNQVSLEPPSFKGKEYAFVNRDSATQACLLWVKKGPFINDKDIPAFKVSSSIINFRLFNEVRNKLGKTYGISMSYNEQENDGIYFVLTQMRTKEMYSTLLAFENTVSDFFNKGITEKELKQNITKLKNEYLSVSQPASIIDFYNPLIYPDIKKRMTYISDLEALTTDAVNKVIKKYYNPDSYKLVIAGNEIKLADQLSKLKGLQKFNNNAIEVDQ